MSKQTLSYDKPFDVTWTIRAKGRTQVDGKVFAMTAQIVRDVLQKALDDMIIEKKLIEYDISVTVNNIEEAEKTLMENR